jgi:hypothetical protein
MFSSLVSLCTICASTKCYSTASASFDSSMNTISTDVAPSLFCFLACQCCLLLHKNSIIDVPIVFVLNYHFCKLYLLIICLPFHKDDDECGDDLTSNGWIFNTPFLITLHNSSSTFVFFNNFASSSCLCLCSFLYTSLSLVIFYSFLMVLSAFMLLWTPKLWKHA